MNELKYKVGDKVRLTERTLAIYETADDVFEIVNANKNMPFPYTIKSGPISFVVNADEIAHAVVEVEERKPTSLDDALGMVKPKQLEKRLMTLPTDSARRKEFPILSGFLKYFPAAIAGAANTSKLGNDKHNPGQELHHARGKSMDHGDCIVRHLMDVEDLISAQSKNNKDVTTEAILLEVNQMVWRALAYSQELHEKYGAPLAPSAKKEEGK